MLIGGYEEMNKLNDLLHELGISKVKLAKFLGVSRQMIYNYLELDDLNKWPKDKKVLLLNLLGIKSAEELKDIKVDTDYIMNVEARLNSLVDNEDRRVPYSNMIYIGDGLTDVPCMKVVKERGGESIAIYHKDSLDIAKRLLKEKRVGFICKADYSGDSELETLVKLLINQMALSTQLSNLHKEQTINFLGEKDEE